MTNNINFFKCYKPTISRALRQTLFTQGDTRKLSDDDFELYKNQSGNCSMRCEGDLVSTHLNEIDGMIDFDTLNNLKEFSSKIADLDKKIKSKTFDLNNCTGSNSSSRTTTISDSGSTTNAIMDNTTSNTTTNDSNTTTSSNMITRTKKIQITQVIIYKYKRKTKQKTTI